MYLRTSYCKGFFPLRIEVFTIEKVFRVWIGRENPKITSGCCNFVIYRIYLNSSRAGILLEQKFSSELFESAR